jgi:hypothetical protein
MAFFERRLNDRHRLAVALRSLGPGHTDLVAAERRDNLVNARLCFILYRLSHRALPRFFLPPNSKAICGILGDMTNLKTFRWHN